MNGVERLQAGDVDVRARRFNLPMRPFPVVIPVQ
jgi:hypothetical protein